MRTTLPVLLALTLAAPAAWAQERVPAESLVFRARSSRFGGMGRATMWTRDAELRGVPVALARFEFRTRVALFTVEDRSASWIEGSTPDALRALRYTKHERNPLGGTHEEVDVVPETRSWSARDGRSGALATEHPLDELSFIYLVRMLSLLDGDGTMEIGRHYDSARNPVRITQIGRDTVETTTGRFRVLTVEMRVRDPRRYKGEGVIRFDLSDDACRLPVRIRSAVPMAGASTLTLESYTREGAFCTARLDGTTSVLPVASRP
jgi:hypothetical protein